MYGVVDLAHDGGADERDVAIQAALVYGTDLFQQSNGPRDEEVVSQVHVRNLGACLVLAGDRGDDGCWAALVAEVILNYEYGPDTALLAAEDWFEIGIVNLPSFDFFFHGVHSFEEAERYGQAMVHGYAHRPA